jgi:hypothetical protein
MFRDLCVAFVSIYLFTHAVDFFTSVKSKYEKIKKEIPINVNDNKSKDYYRKETRVEKSNSPYYVEKSNDVEEYRVGEQYNSENAVDKMVFIRALGYADESSLSESARAVRDYFGIPTEILTRVGVDESMFLNDSINADIVLERFRDNTTKTIYVTNYPMTNYAGLILGGYTCNKSKVIVVCGESGVRHLTTHEMGHTFGLKHCEDTDCFMHYKYIKDADDFCQDCKNKLIVNYPTLNKIYDKH